MVVEKGTNYKDYQLKLEEVERILSLDNNRPKIIWLYQYPTIDFWGSNDAGNAIIFADKIHQYNLILRRVFR